MRFGGRSNQFIAEPCHKDKIDIGACCNAHVVIAIAGIRESAVGEREKKSAVADAIAVDHARCYRHPRLGDTWLNNFHRHAEVARRLIIIEHLLRASLGQFHFVHLFPFRHGSGIRL